MADFPEKKLITDSGATANTLADDGALTDEQRFQLFENIQAFISRRIVAKWLDFLIISPFISFIFGLSGFTTIAVMQLFVFLNIFYFTQWHLIKNTIGKRYLQVVFKSSPSYAVFFAREVLSWIGFLGFGLGVFSFLTDRRRRLWHEKMTGSTVQPASVETAALESPNPMEVRMGQALFASALSFTVFLGSIAYIGIHTMSESAEQVDLLSLVPLEQHKEITWSKYCQAQAEIPSLQELDILAAMSLLEPVHKDCVKSLATAYLFSSTSASDLVSFQTERKFVYWIHQQLESDPVRQKSYAALYTKKDLQDFEKKYYTGQKPFSRIVQAWQESGAGANWQLQTGLKKILKPYQLFDTFIEKSELKLALEKNTSNRKPAQADPEPVDIKTDSIEARDE